MRAHGVGLWSWVVLVALAACGGGGAGNADGGSDAGSTGTESCYSFNLGSTCPLTLAPSGIQEFFFRAPGQDWSLMTMSLTGSTTFAVWALEEPDHAQTWCDDFTFGVDQSCVAVVKGGSPYHLFVFEAAGRAGTTHLTIGRSHDMGSVAKPVPVSTDSLVNGSVGAGGSSYFSFQAARSTSHTLSITGLFSQLSWELYRDPGYLDPILECAFTDHAADLACRASLTAGSTYYLRVREFSGAPQDFQLTIGSGALDEGAAGSPVPLVVGAPSRSSTVDVFGHSHYTLTPAVSGPHAIQLSGHSIVLDGISRSFLGDYAWTLFDDPGFTHVVTECRDYRGIRSGSEHCVAPLAAGVPYYLRVDERAGYPNRVYELTAVARTAGGGTSEGSVGAPVPVTFTSGFGTVAALGSSYYSFQAGASAASHRIIVSSEQDDFFFPGSNLSWSLFDDIGFSNEIARCDRATGIVAQSCLTPALSPSATYYLRVDENDGIAQDFGLLLYGGFPPPTPSSPQAPVSIPVGSTGLDVVQDNTLSTGFYAFAASQPGTYRITANLATGDVYGLVAWYLYDDAAFSHPVAHCFRSDDIQTPGASCTVALPAGAEYLKVQAVGEQSGDPGSIMIGSNDLHLGVERLGP